VSNPKKEEKSKGAEEHKTCCCPFCLSSRMMEEAKEQYSGFFTHLRQARIEVLRAFRTLMDERISSLEKSKKKVTKVKVE
jgi:wobble nucleotide-excising tRNase